MLRPINDKQDLNSSRNLIKMDKRRKRTTMILIISAAAVCFLTALAVFLLPNLISGMNVIGRDELSNVKYVSNSGLDYKEYSELILGKYSVHREGSVPNAGKLVIKCIKDESNDKDYITYWVFDSAEDAKKSYQNQYDFIIKYDNEHGGKGKDRILSKGKNWFVADMPASDAKITTIYYLADNVVMYANVSYTSYGTTAESESPRPSAASSISGDRLINFIKDNAADLRRFVLTEICPKITKESKSN